MDDIMKKNRKKIFMGLITVSLIALFLVGNKFGKNVKQLSNVEINGDTFAVLLDDKKVSTLPSKEAYLIDYTCDNGSTLEWNRETGKLSLSKKTIVQENCSLTFKTNPLLAELKQGDYVGYHGEACSDGKEPCEGFNANYSLGKGQAYGYCYLPDYPFYVMGWRIAYIEGGRAYLISAGAPECYIKKSFDEYTRARQYCNSDFVDEGCSDNTDSWPVNDNDFYKMISQITGENGRKLNDCVDVYSEEACGYNNDLIDNGGYYWFADYMGRGSTILWGPYKRRVYKSDGSQAFGLRPVIRLSTSVYVTGGSGTMNDPYTIANNYLYIHDNETSYTLMSNVTLKLNTTEDVSQMCISNTEDCTNYEDFAISKSWTLPPGDGEKKIYVYYKNNSGEIVTSIEKTVILDTVPPTDNSVQISDGDGPARTLTLASTGAEYMCFSNTSSNPGLCKEWVNFNTTYPWTLSPYSGKKTVYAFFKDKAGNVARAQASVTCNSCTGYIVNEDFSDTTYDSNLTLEGIGGRRQWLVSNGQLGSSTQATTATIAFTPTNDSKLSFDYGITADARASSVLTITLTGTDSSSRELLNRDITGETYTENITNITLNEGVTYTLTLNFDFSYTGWIGYGSAYIDNLVIGP